MTDLLLYAAVLIGVAAAGYLVARSPQFWVGLAIVVGERAWPLLIKMFARMTPEEEAAWHQAIREGREKEWRNERARKKLKPWFGGRKDDKR